jgi:multidrug transporter EmrE-like cation transporter
MSSWLFLIITIVLTAAANIFLKFSANRSTPPVQGLWPNLVHMCTNIPLITGIGFLAIAVISYSLALRQINLSIAYPIMTTSVVVIVAFFSTLLFAEPITLNKIIGTIIVICGVILLSQQ